MGEMKKGDVTKRRIVRSATRLIHRNGYKNTSVDDILKDCDVTKGSFYFHFRNKDEVAKAAAKLFYSHVEKNLLVMSEGDESGSLDRISSILDLMTEGMEKSGCTGGCLLGNMALELSDSNEEVRGELADIFHDFRERLKVLIDRGQKEGVIRIDRGPEELANFVLAVIEGGLLLSKVMKDIAPLKDAKDQAVTFLSPEGEIS